MLCLKLFDSITSKHLLQISIRNPLKNSVTILIGILKDLFVRDIKFRSHTLQSSTPKEEVDK